MKNSTMNTLLQIQLKKIYGKEFQLQQQDEKFLSFLQLVEEAYDMFEYEEKLLEKTLEVNAKELEKANEELLKKHELLKSVENSIDDAIFYKDLQQRYIGCNKKFAAFLGMKEEDIIGKTDFDFFEKDTALSFFKLNEELIQKKQKYSYKHWLLYQEKKIYVMTNKTPLINDQGKVIGIVVVSKDITKEYEMQQEIERKNVMLIQQNKLIAMGEMIANIAHQWRQPLNTLGIILQKIGILYQKKLLTPKEMETNIVDAMDLMQEMSTTIDDFRNFFNPEKLSEVFDLHEIILKAFIIIKPTLIDNDIAVTINAKGKYNVYGHKNEFFQVVLNILHNAIEALILDEVSHPCIVIDFEKKAEEICITISDNASGILESVKEKIFDPYFTTKEHGTGIGLYMSKIIIEEHMQGRIFCSTSERGTKFTLIIPTIKP